MNKLINTKSLMLCKKYLSLTFTCCLDEFFVTFQSTTQNYFTRVQQIYSIKLGERR